MPRQYLSTITKEHPYLAEIASKHGGMVEVAILRIDKARAYECVDQAFRELESYIKPQPTSATRLDEILDSRTATILSHSGVSTVGSLLQYDEETILELRFISSKMVDRIKKQLSEYGLSLRSLEEN